MGKGSPEVTLRGSLERERAAGGNFDSLWKESPCRSTFCGQVPPELACLSPS